MRQQAKGYALQFTARVPSNWQWLELEAVFKGHDSYLEPSSSRFEICPTTDVEFLKTSVKICESNHERCVAVAGSITPEKMLIIDLEDMCVKPAPGGCRYVALSYVWGKITENWLALTRDNFVSMGRKNALIGASLPHTIKDAMQLCLDLGEQYLWIDSLCILQDDPVSQKQQIDIMDLIYASATLTIVAAAGDHANSGLPGIRRWSRTAKRQTITIQDIEISNILPRMADTAEKSVWNTRGWTYQERMFSRRCIFLTDGQAFYACSEE
ncbi:HET-domain-containing protein, partial [Mollisia scopiformis]